MALICQTDPFILQNHQLLQLGNKHSTANSSSADPMVATWNACRHVEDVLLQFTVSVRRGERGDFSDFEPNQVVGVVRVLGFLKNDELVHNCL